MTKKINVSPALIATAVFVKATVKSRCRAGMVFNNQTETRVELDQLPEGGLAAIEADPYLKVTYETEEMPEEAAEGRILELETKLADKEAELASANEQIANLNVVLEEKQAGFHELKTQLEAIEAEIAESKAATTPKAKK